ncbi:MAG: hypothetical protein ABI741_00895 [Ferruginibacter sp.]
MIEIILLFILTKSMGALAAKKGLPPGKWKFITVITWLAFEMIGVVLGLIFFGQRNLLGLMAFALVCAFGGYLTVKYVLDNKPDEKINDDIDRIGTRDLRP